MKKLFGIVAVAVLAVSLLVSCSSDNDTDVYDVSSTIEVGYNNEDATAIAPRATVIDTTFGNLMGIADLMAFGDFEFVELMFSDSLAVFEQVAERIELFNDELANEFDEELAVIIAAAVELFDVAGIITEDDIAIIIDNLMFVAEVIEAEMDLILDIIPHDFIPNEEAMSELGFYLGMQGLGIWEMLDVIEYISLQEDHELYYEALIIMVMVDVLLDMVIFADYYFADSLEVIDAVAGRIEGMGEQVLVLFVQLEDIASRAYDLAETFEVITEEEIEIVLNNIESVLAYFENDFLAELEAMLESFEDMIYSATMEMLEGLNDFDLGAFGLNDFDLGAFDLNDFDLDALEDLITDELYEIIQNLDISDLLSQILSGN